MNGAAGEERRDLREGTALLAIGVLAVAVGGYFVLRYLGQWAEVDTSRFVGLARNLQEAGSIFHDGAYVHGFAYTVWSAMLGGLTGIAADDLTQLYLPVLGNVFLAVFGFAAFRRFLGSERLGLMAAGVLFLVPELVFTMSRGNHEKLTVSLTLLAMLALLNGYTEMGGRGRWPVFAGWVLCLYLTVFTLVSINVFFGSSFIAASTLALAFAWVALRFRSLRSAALVAVTRRLTLVVGVSWLLVGLVMWYVYPPAGSVLRLFDTALERVAVLVVTATAESDPYALAPMEWASLGHYRLVSAFRWVLFAGSFVTWLVLLFRDLPRLHVVPLGRLFLIAFYGAFGLQMVLAVPVDLVNLASGTNLQVRNYTYFALVAAPMFTLGLSRVLAWAGRARPGVEMLASVTLSALLVISVLKFTLDPVVSNRWLFYRSAEIDAIRFWDGRGEHQSLWVDFEGRLRSAYVVEASGTTNGNTLSADPRDPRATSALRSSLLEESARAWRQPPPAAWQGDRVYDNGETQIYRRIPRTPFQR